MGRQEQLKPFVDITVEAAKQRELGRFIEKYTIEEPCGCVTQLKPIGTILCPNHAENDPLRTKEPI